MGKRKGTSAAKKRDRRDQRQKVPCKATLLPLTTAASCCASPRFLSGRIFGLVKFKSTSRRSTATQKWCVTAAKTSRRTEPFAISAVQCSDCLSVLSVDAQSAWLQTVLSLMLARVQQVWCAVCTLIVLSSAECSNATYNTSMMPLNA